MRASTDADRQLFVGASRRTCRIQFTIDARKRLPDVFAPAYFIGNAITHACVDFGRSTSELSISQIAVRIRQAVDRYTTPEEVTRCLSAHRASTVAGIDIIAPRWNASTLFSTNFATFSADLKRNNEQVEWVHSLLEAPRYQIVHGFLTAFVRDYDGGFRLTLALHRSAWSRFEQALRS